MILVLDKLLNNLIESKSLLLLEVLFPIFKEEKHIHSHAINNAINAYLDRLTESDHKAVFDLCFREFIDFDVHFQLKLNVSRKLAIPLLYRMNQQNVIEIFTIRLPYLMEVLNKSEPKSFSLPIRSTTTGGAGEIDNEERKIWIAEQICIFSFLQVHPHFPFFDRSIP